MSRVVALQKTAGVANYDLADGNNVYIGRNLCMGGWNVRASIYQNPFKVDDEGVGSSLKKYYNMLVKKANVPSFIDVDLIRSTLDGLKDKTLCCWCKKKSNCKRDGVKTVDEIRCHGDVLMFLINLPTSRRLELFDGAELNEEDRAYMPKTLHDILM